MNSVLTKPRTIEGLYRTYFSFANKFQFTDLLRNYIQSEEWKDKSQQNVWDIISAISDDIGAVLTDDIVNYTRNVVDVNTCKMPQLIEHARMLSYNIDNLKNSYDMFPKRIQCLVDIFSVNPEYLFGNHKNHILSDEVIKEILIYIRERTSDKSLFLDGGVIDKLIDDPHSLIQYDLYKQFVKALFFQSIVDALSSGYSDDSEPMVFNMLFKEIVDSDLIINDIDRYRSWIDRFINDEIEHPLNEPEPRTGSDHDSVALPGTIYDYVQQVKSQKRMSAKFNPFKIADNVYFYGLNPSHNMSEDELALVEKVLNYHAKPKYDYKNQMFTSDETTQYAYYKELEFCEYLKMVRYLVNCLDSITLSQMNYEVKSNKFIQQNDANMLSVVKVFYDGEQLIHDSVSGDVVLNYDVIEDVARFLCDFAFNVQHVRENMKTIAQKHSMRGSEALLVHMVNDYLIKELPLVRDRLYENADGEVDMIQFAWETDPSYAHHKNVKLVEYEDDNEYFNIDPYADVRFTERTNARYWEKLEGMSDDDTLGVLTKGQIKDFYRNTLGMGILQKNKRQDYDDVKDFLVDLFRIGANPISYDSDTNSLNNPIDDILNKSEEDFGYTKQERAEVQTNVQLRENQEEQFIQYSGNEDLISDTMYDMIGNRIFNWKNRDYSSHVLHPFMYNLKVWNRLNNIIVNGYKDYVNNDLIDLMSSTAKFDQLFGEFGEGKNFWKYNIQDWSGYTTRYEAAIKDEHLDDGNHTVSALTGYDGLFYPSAAKEFLDHYNAELALDDKAFVIPEGFFTGTLSESNDKWDNHPFLAAVYSIYWQLNDYNANISGSDFYCKWYSHLNYTQKEYRNIAMQLWYWRDRIRDMMVNEYPINKYCLDEMGNSLILVSPFNDDDVENDKYLVDLTIAQNQAENLGNNGKYGNKNFNRHAPVCDNKLMIPNELWVRFKSNPIAFPSIDINFGEPTGDSQFDLHCLNMNMGQISYMNNDCNQGFAKIVKKWKGAYPEDDRKMKNMFPVFFDMEQSAGVLTLASWNFVQFSDETMFVSSGKNPYHIVSMMNQGDLITEYLYKEYGDNSKLNTDNAFTVKEVDKNETIGLNWLFGGYQYSPCDGYILIPMYRFECDDSSETIDNHDTHQHLFVRVFLVSAQKMQSDELTQVPQIQDSGAIDINLNERVGVYDNVLKYRFDYPIKACKSTNVVFSAYTQDNGRLSVSKMKCAFLGCYASGQGGSSFKVSSCDAKTRYEYDSQDERNLALLKDGYYRGTDKDWGEGTELDDRKYIDNRIYGSDSQGSFNSYDSLDKYVFVVDFEPAMDTIPQSMQKHMKPEYLTYAYNILCDSGFIPHFAYQSTMKYADKDGGIAYIWKNKYLDQKQHHQFELLGLDNIEVPHAYDVMSMLRVHDSEDDCDTYLSPAKLMSGIFRIWQEKKKHDNDDLESYFDNEYKEYVNPELTFNANGESIWECEEKFTLDFSNDYILNQDNNDDGEYRRLLDEYYISVLRVDGGEIQNERKYMLPPTKLSDVMTYSNQDKDGFVKCNLTPYKSASVQDNHFVNTQVLFVGTPDPFNRNESGERVFSLPESLQYGNGICGVDNVFVKVDVVDITDDKNSVIGKGVKPTLKITKFRSSSGNLIDKIQSEKSSVDPGTIMVILSHKNLDNIAKYHILNKTGSLYFGSSISKSWRDDYKRKDQNGFEYIDPYMTGYDYDPTIKDFNYNPPKTSGNKFKYSDFKSDMTVEIEFKDGKWIQKGLKEGETPLIEFKDDDVHYFKPSDVLNEQHIADAGLNDNDKLPPYYVDMQKVQGGVPIIWFLEQDEIQESRKIEFTNPDGSKRDRIVPEPGNFKYAHRQMTSQPTLYLDYLYVKRGNLRFKINEESQFFGDSLEQIPPFQIDESLKNKMNDLNDIRVLTEYSTFIHQDESPEQVRVCKNLNPLNVNTILKYGLLGDEDSKVITFNDNKLQILLDNNIDKTKLGLELEDGEIDDALKIYTTYVKVDDGNGDFHFDLYFNIQNLFNSPFEYISSITGQANALILPDSYLYLSGAKYKRDDGNNVIDDEKVKQIKQGGTLTIYGQAKTYSDDVLKDVKTLKLFQYKVYNISDDKPKFLIKKVYDISDATLIDTPQNDVQIKFEDVMWTVDQNKFNKEQGDFKVLNQDIIVVQPVHVKHNWQPDSTNRITSISFDIVNDVIDFENTPELLGYYYETKTLKHGEKPYYDHWSDKYMEIEKIHSGYRLTLKYDEDCGFNFETIYLRWRLPAGFDMMNTIDRLGFVMGCTASNIEVKCMDQNNTLNVVDANVGHIFARVPNINDMYLGLEHSTTQRKNGFVLTSLSGLIAAAIKETAIKESAKQN